MCSPQWGEPHAFIIFHGYGGSAEQLYRTSGFTELSVRHGVPVFYPQALIKGTWDIPGSQSPATKAQAQDVKFVLDVLIPFIESTYAVPREKMIFVGVSQGAAMATDIALSLSSTSVGIIAFTLAAARVHVVKNESAPTRAIIFCGSNDPLVPARGGLVRRAKVEVTGGKEAAQLLARRNNVPFITQSTDTGYRCVSTLDHTILTEFHTGDWGHVWPGVRAKTDRIFGGNTQSINATNQIWKFFLGSNYGTLELA